MSAAVPFPPEGITLLLRSPDRGKPTKDWIGKPSEEDIDLFLWFLLDEGNVATRRPAVSGHQNLLMRGNFCAYGLPTSGIRTSDLTRRIYACVRVLELAGETNWEACRRVAAARYLEYRLGKTKRGRRPKPSASADFLNKVNTVRGIYNSAKGHHRWKEGLPERDQELEYWWGHFLLFKEWAQAEYAIAIAESQRRAISMDDLCKEIKGRAEKPGAVISSVIGKIREILGD
jgi:hypothetical protein